MTKTIHQQNNEGIQAAAFQAALESKVLQGLGIAIENAVAAQNELYVTGQAALVNALQTRLSSMEGSAKAEKSESKPPSLEELTERLQGIAKTSREANVEQTVLPDDPARTTARLMRAFALALAMLNEVNVQQMLDYILVTLASDVSIHDIDAGDARILVDLLTNNRLVQMFAELKSVGGLSQYDT